jgi:thiamine kinase-like enzyme
MTNPAVPHTDALFPLKGTDSEQIAFLCGVLKIAPPHDAFAITQPSGGTTNSCFMFSTTTKKYTVRVYGNNTDLMIDRNKELAHIIQIGLFTAYASFTNGLIVTFREGRPITTAEMADPVISDKIAEKIGILHKVTFGEPGHQNEMIIKTLTLLNKIDGDTDLFDKSMLEEKVRWVQEYLAKELADVPFALCHCDLFEGNLIWDEGNQDMNFIDWEYCGWTWPHYDIADHFFEYGGLDLNASSYPTLGQQKRFLRVYLRTLYGTEPDEELVDK